MTEAEYARIRAGFEECNRRMQEYSGEISGVKGSLSTITDQIQRLKDAVAMAMARVNDVVQPPKVIKEIMVGDKVETRRGEVGTVEAVGEAFVVAMDVSGAKETILAENLKRVK